MIKKILLGLFVGFILLIGFSSAGKIQVIGLDGQASIYNNQYELTFLPKGALKTMFLGTAKGVIAFDNDKLFWWGSDGIPYFYGPNFQGQYGQFFSCSVISGDNIPSNCVAYNIDGSQSEMWVNFFKNVGAGDYVYYDYDYSWGGNTCHYDSKASEVCFSSSTLNASLCFKNSSCYNGCQNGASQCENFCNGIGGCNGYLTGSKNYENLSFGNIPITEIGYAPGQNGYMGGGNIEGGSQEVGDGALTGDVQYSVCTNEKALTYYQIQGYSEKLCYSSYGNTSDLYLGASSVSDFALTGVAIKDVWVNTRSYRRNGLTGDMLYYSEWFSYWRKTYEAYQKVYEGSGSHTNPFLNVPVSIFTLMGNINAYGLAYTDNSILEYCDLKLYKNKDSVYTGILGTVPCTYSAIDIIADSYGVHPSDGQLVEGSSWEGILNRTGYSLGTVWGSGSGVPSSSGGLVTYNDGSQFMNDTFNAISTKFRFPDNLGIIGIIPNYILVFMVALILFRFLSH